MKGNRFSEERIIGILQEAETGAQVQKDSNEHTRMPRGS